MAAIAGGDHGGYGMVFCGDFNSSKEEIKMPCNYKEYPKNWKWISSQIIKDAGDRCELCYAQNGAEIVRIKSNKYPWNFAHEVEPSIRNEFGIKVIKVVLTVHHIDSDKKNNSKQNLIALCQRCHLRLDLQKHMKNRMVTQGKK
jgi:hypothetical protein